MHETNETLSPAVAPPETPRPTPLSLVAQCDARDCLYNRDALCAAGAVSIAFVGGVARCATYQRKAGDVEKEGQ